MGIIDGNWHEIIMLLGRIANVAVPMIKALAVMVPFAAITMMPHIVVVIIPTIIRNRILRSPICAVIPWAVLLRRFVGEPVST